ncbi:MAG: hypothetical protein IKT95_07260 [Spirochaetales bacterium]|nr:hypothetical protein [Spirochaetales bacterium]
MTREEILEKSQNENKGKDFAEMEIIKKALMTGWVVTVCLVGVVLILNGVVLGYEDKGSLFAIMTGLFIVFLTKYIKLRKKHELFITIAYGIAAVAFLVSWIMTLIGV